MLKVIETFSGIGSQAKALSNIDIDYKIISTVEWDINAIIAYCLIHFGKINVDEFEDLSETEITEELKKYTLSSDGKNPMSNQALNRMSIDIKKALLVAIKKTNNLGSITDIQGSDIEDGIDLLTYSFPCQDLSLCGNWHGNKSGISRNANNRSGMLWEIERILKEMIIADRGLPKFLLMENVTNILSRTHAEDFDSWTDTLKDIGYYNEIYRLNSKKFGIPQNRERAYMISVRCNKDKNLENKLANYFHENNLEKNEVYPLRRSLSLRDILKLDYTNAEYKMEADLSNPNDTPSRQEIYKDNDKLLKEEGINDIIVNTITTKQDRNPNSGVINYKSDYPNKSNFRYITARECFLLMGFDERDYQVLCDNNYMRNKSKKLFTNDKLIKLAGNSIVVDVLEAIFKQIIDIDKTVLKSIDK